MPGSTAPVASWSLEMAARGDLPPRYGQSYRARFDHLALGRLAAGTRTLDLGSGRDPVFPVDRRPSDLTYVGLDISERELSLAPAGSYDEAVVADASSFVPELE